MRGLPIELLERIVSAQNDQGMAPSEIADVFQVSMASVYRFIKAANAGETLVPNGPTGGPRKLGQRELQWLRSTIETNPFTTSYELTSKYNQEFRSNRVHRSTILRAMHELGYTHKKRLQ